MIVFILITICVLLLAWVLYQQMHGSRQEPPSSSQRLNDKDEKIPAKLLDLNTTTVAERQRAYGRGVCMQLRYDMLQRQTELAGDTETLEAIRTNTYDGPLPELDDDISIPTTNRRRQPIANPKVQELRYFCIKDKGYHVSVWPKDQYIPDYVEFNIAGLSYRDNIDNYLGEHVGRLETEPTNPYDSNAIKVLAHDGHKVGYVPKDMTSEVRKFTNLPCSCYLYIGRSNDGTYYSDCYIITPPK